MQVQSLHPKAMTAHMGLYMAIMVGKSGLSREEREMIAVAVSATNGCEYCVRHHGAALLAYWKDPERVERFSADPLSEREGRMAAVIVYAVELTRSPGAVDEKHIRDLREAGLGDEEIVGVNLIVSYFNFVTRLAEGLGVEVTDEEVSGYRY